MILPRRRMRLVVDASVAVKWFIVEPDGELAIRLTDSASFELHAPSHWLAEIANVVWVRTRATGESALESETADEILHALVQSDVESHAIAPVLELAFVIATTCGVTVYDALYVATAERLDVPFVTADTRLIRRLRGTPWAGRSLSLRDIPAAE